MKTKKILAIGIVAILVCGVGLVVAQAPSKEYVVIKAPLSLEEGENVYHIPQSSIVYHSADGITTVYTSDGKPILKARDSDTTQIPVPAGVSVPATYITQSPSGSRVTYEPFKFHTKDRGLIVTEKATRIYGPDGSLLLTIISEKSKIVPYSGLATTKYRGWAEKAYETNADSFIKFVAYWSCPSAPPSPSSDVVDYLFNAFQCYPMILQSVLEWNYAGSGRWTGAPWWGPDENGEYHRGGPIEISVGDSLEGKIWWEPSPQVYAIQIRNQDTSSTSVIYAGNPGIMEDVFLALEVYNVDDDNDVPGDTDFHSMTFEGDTPIWKGDVDENAPLSGLNVEIVSQPDRVILHTAN